MFSFFFDKICISHLLFCFVLIFCCSIVKVRFAPFFRKPASSLFSEALILYHFSWILSSPFLNFLQFFSWPEGLWYFWFCLPVIGIFSLSDFSACPTASHSGSLAVFFSTTFILYHLLYLLSRGFLNFFKFFPRKIINSLRQFITPEFTLKSKL